MSVLSRALNTDDRLASAWDELNTAKDDYKNPDYPMSRLIKRFEKEVYDISWENWHKALPYGFRWRDYTGKEVVFYLPLAPNNIQITTHFATNLIPTMYGTVEEHSEQRYFDIVISGTTGIAPKHYQPETEDSGTRYREAVGRQSFEIAGGSLLGGFAARTEQTIRDSVKDIVSLGSDLGITSSPTEVSGINERQSGYTAFHNFYRFLMLYKKDAASGKARRINRGKQSAHPLQFLNYKDRNQYDVAISSFQLVRSSDDPMLYNYNIVLRAYNLKTVNAPEYVTQDRYDDLGLGGVDSQSYFSKMSNIASKAKNTAYRGAAIFKGIGS